MTPATDAREGARRLRALEGRLRLEHRSGVAGPWADDWVAAVRAPDGVTLVRPWRSPADGEAWAALFEDEAHGLDLPGMLSAVLRPLAGAAVPVFVASTFAADLVLVPGARLEAAVEALRSVGFAVDTAAAGTA